MLKSTTRSEVPQKYSSKKIHDNGLVVFFLQRPYKTNGLYPTVATGADTMNEEGGKGRLEAFVRVPPIPSQGTEAALDVPTLPGGEIRTQKRQPSNVHTHGSKVLGLVSLYPRGRR